MAAPPPFETLDAMMSVFCGVKASCRVPSKLTSARRSLTAQSANLMASSV
jgi:hypothetical protein